MLDTVNLVLFFTNSYLLLRFKAKTLLWTSLKTPLMSQRRSDLKRFRRRAIWWIFHHASLVVWRRSLTWLLLSCLHPSEGKSSPWPWWMRGTSRSSLVSSEYARTWTTEKAYIIFMRLFEVSCFSIKLRFLRWCSLTTVSWMWWAVSSTTQHWFSLNDTENS